MEELDLIDEDTSIEEYPGYCGMTWDGELYLGPELKILEDFDWSSYWDLVSEHGEPRRISLLGLPYAVKCEFEAYSDLAVLLDQIPSIQVKYDNGPKDAGPASGEGYVFFIADGVSMERLTAEVSALKAALDKDLQSLSPFNEFLPRKE
jgi:hypothetical protein